MRLPQELQAARMRRRNLAVLAVAARLQLRRAQGLLPVQQRANPELLEELGLLDEAIALLRQGHLAPEPPLDQAGREADKCAALALQGESTAGLFDEQLAPC